MFLQNVSISILATLASATVINSTLHYPCRATAILELPYTHYPPPFPRRLKHACALSNIATTSTGIQPVSAPIYLVQPQCLLSITKVLSLTHSHYCFPFRGPTLLLELYTFPFQGIYSTILATLASATVLKSTLHYPCRATAILELPYTQNPITYYLGPHTASNRLHHHDQ